jgi:drug/metabolite transporter (DMT)-like permease
MPRWSRAVACRRAPCERSRRAGFASVAALGAVSIIVGAAIGAVFFKERFGIPRIAAAGLLVVGIGLMLYAG